MIMISKGLSCFSHSAIGTRVTDPSAFMQMLATEVKTFDFGAQPTPGQGFIPLPPAAVGMVSCGTGLRVPDPEAYVPRMHRGRVELYLRRPYASTAENVFAVVYDREAYGQDPDVQADHVEVARLVAEPSVRFVLIAVIASAGPKPTVSELRFVANLAGGNNSYLPRDEDVDTYHRRISRMAKETAEYAAKWCTVAD